MKSRLFFSNRFFILMIAIGFLMIMSFFKNEIFNYVLGVFYLTLFVFVLEFILLWRFKNPVDAKRVVPSRMSNDDLNTIKIQVRNKTPFNLKLEIQEELPYQLNLRNFVLKDRVKSKKGIEIFYEIQPKVRGKYEFGNLNVFLSLGFGLIQRKMVIEQQQYVKVYPSYQDLNQYDLKTLKTTRDYGGRKNRKVGHSMEFEQIRDYVMGDDIRHINWKATAKRNDFMINQYNDEKSKEVYCIVDTGRNMKFPFNGLALVDYAINASLVILKNVLNNDDKAGMLSFNKKAKEFVKAEKRPSHINLILEKLYAIRPEFYETDFSNLYVYLKRMVSHRSLLLLFTNFENYDSFERQLPYLQAINKSHVLVVIFFKNKEIEDHLYHSKVHNVYQQTIMEKQINEKNRIVSELNQRKIQTVLTLPENLTIDLLNKYLEIKAKALI